MRLLILVFFFFIACSDTEVDLNVFEVGGKDITYELLVNNGYTQTSVDVLMLETQVGDTTIAFEFGYEPMSLYSKIWTFKLSNEYKHVLKSLFEKNDIYLMAPNTYEEIKGNEFFCVKGHRSNRVYFCNLRKEDNQTEIDIIYYYPE